jgi:hypothetical protein
LMYAARPAMAARAVAVVVVSMSMTAALWRGACLLFKYGHRQWQFQPPKVTARAARTGCQQADPYCCFPDLVPKLEADAEVQSGLDVVCAGELARWPVDLLQNPRARLVRVSG